MYSYLRRAFVGSTSTSSTLTASNSAVSEEIVVVVPATSEVIKPASTLQHASTIGTVVADNKQQQAALLHTATYPLDQHEANILGVDPTTALGSPISHDGRMHRRKRPGRFADACGFTKHGCPRLCAYGVCCGLLLVFAFLLAFFLWARLPELGTFNVDMPKEGSPFKQVGNGFVLSFFLLLQIKNPNFLGAQFSSIQAKAYLPVMPDLLLANGTADDVSISARNETTIRFPFTLRYSQSDDPKSLILADLADRCGIRGSHPPRPIVISYTVNALWKVGAIQVELPQFKATANFDCPVTTSDNTTLLTGVPMESINQARLISP
ncbi:hypothetical protein BDF22DRAFT_703915 [Syncephalis plumigaleata]|nr:hypothetical protein BDF22DRAFT_703915 [Syncephalis plumigaleata]